MNKAAYYKYSYWGVVQSTKSIIGRKEITNGDLTTVKDKTNAGITAHTATTALLTMIMEMGKITSPDMTIGANGPITGITVRMETGAIITRTKADMETARMEIARRMGTSNLNVRTTARRTTKVLSPARRRTARLKEA